MTKIEWTDETWNPVHGCTKCSPGCLNCYAERMAKTRLRGRFGYSKDNPFAVTLHWDRLDDPMDWKQPKKIFTVSMGDLFHTAVPFGFIENVFDTAICCPAHTFQILTKRPDRMLEFSRKYGKFPKNIWAGTSVCNQTETKNIKYLLQVDASVLFVSIEPMLGPIDISPYLKCQKTMDECHARGLWPNCAPLGGHSCSNGLSWVILGGESGPGARPMHPDWVRSVRDQCQEAGTPFFFKQWGNYTSVYDRDVDDPDWTQCATIKKQNQPGQWLNIAGGQGFHGDRVQWVKRVDKKSAGRTLDGRTWDEFPEVAHG